MKPIVIASRGSKLALWQANYVADKLYHMGFQCEVKVISTEGDRVQNRFLHEFGGKGVFIRELESALKNGEADIAVHSLKDLPVNLPEGFFLPAILKRHLPCDAIIFKESARGKQSDLPQTLSLDHFAKMGKMTIATSSLRRQALFKSVNPEIDLVAVRGNVDTRIRKLNEGDWDALILAAASLERLELNVPHRLIDLEWFVPCAAQGALAIECRDDYEHADAIKKMSDANTNQAACIERLLLKKLGGDCTMPCGVFVDEFEEKTRARALVANYEGNICRAYSEYDQKLMSLPREKIMHDLYEGLVKQGLHKILADISGQEPDLGDVN